VRSSQRIVSVSALLLSVAAGAGRAQAQDEEIVDRGLGLRVSGGGYSSLAHLDDCENVDFKTGYNVDGGLAYQFNRYFAVRGNFTWSRAEARDQGPATISPIAGIKFNRFIYDGDLQFRYPFRSGVAPYVFAGGGAITTKQRDTDNTDSFTKGAGKFGVGVNYQVPRSRVAVFVEGTTWVYKWQQYGYDKTQFDVSWNGGLSCTF
jgi:Outer membrane protein beta-barrel domain